MNRLKLLAAAMLLAVPIACGDEVPPPPPTGSIDGLVSIEGQGIDGISVTLSNGGSAITANGGMYRFDGVEAGAYTVTISNYPDDASFSQTSSAATIATDGETVTVNFPGTYIRTSSIMGTVTVDNEGLNGITVTISGTGDSETLTDGNGQYAFTGLRAGNYTIEISGFDDEDVAFGATSSAASVGVGESKVVAFEGTYVRTSGVMGQVTADGQPQEGINVSLQGRGENRSMATNSAGQFSFDELRRGDYAVGISGYDTDQVSFDVTSQSVTVAYGETANVPFAGTLLRTAGIMGTVTVEGVGPIANVTVTIQGEGETRDDMTDHMGVYEFEGLPAGDYSVVISGFDDDEYGFPDGTAATVTVELQETGSVPFDGIMLRTAAIEGTVTVGDDDAPLPGVMVTVSGGPRDEEHATTTNNDGMYMVENLHAGTYSVTISGYDTREYGFDRTTRTLTVDLRDTGEAAFQGDLLRTAGVSGRVHVDGMGLPGVTVTMTGEESREGNTDADGQYSFSGLAAGDYTVTISGWDEVEYAFEPAMEIEDLELDESRSGVNFAGRALRTATVMGYVTVEGDALSGIDVTLIRVVTANSGEVMGTKATGSNGGYSFGPLLAGAYQVMIAGYADEHDFGELGTTQTKFVMTDGTATANFEATIIRTASVSGMVTVDDEAMAGVEVTLAGDHAPDDNTRMTDDDGMYSFGGLRKGAYTVSITNPDADAYSFPIVSLPVNLSVGQPQPGISFAGAMLRTAGISGRVHVDGTGLHGVTVTLTGEESRDPIMTNPDGQYGFPGLAAGDYTLTISGWDEVEYEFEPTMEIEDLELGESRSGQNFEGRALRTATVMGSVTVEGAGLPGIAVTLIKLVTADSGEILYTKPTDSDGAYSFGPLLAGDYQVRIDDNSDEQDFGELGTTRTTMVLTDGTATVNFEATIIRTASVSGMVTVDGEAMEDVGVTLTGDHAPDDNTRRTDDDGMYSFGGLRKGAYTVSITNPDADAYSFPTDSLPVNLSVGQPQPGISFAGARLLQASISGQVHAEGDPVAGVMVTLSGDADGDDMTDDNGEYNFPGLAGGTYTVTIAGWDDAAYIFDDPAQERTIGSDDFEILDFAGTHTKTASIGGMLFIDEGGQTALAHDAGEPVLDLDAVLPEDMPGLPITLLGPELTSAPTPGIASRDGMYSFGNLRAGAYVLNVDVETEINEEGHTVEGLLAYLGYKYTGPSLIQVSVDAAEEKTDVNLPFSITMQTINVGAVMGTPDAATETMVGGVELALYPTAEAADAGAPMLGTATTGADPEMPNHGVATFHFLRAMDLGPGGTGNDHLVFAKVTSMGDADLAFSDNRDIEIQYAATDRVSNAHAAARLVNVQVNFQWWAKSDADATDGNDFLGGWVANNEMATDATGLATYSRSITVDEAIAGAEYEVMLAEAQHDTVSGKERWTQSAALTHAHNHLALPADNTSEMNDLGPIYVTWTTQTLTLGVYREADDVEGFTDLQSELAGGDHRPHSEVGSGMTVDLMTRDSRNRLRVFDKWDHDCDDDGEKEMPTEERDATGNFAAGMISFKCLPADEQFTVRYNAGDDREQMDYDYDEIETFGNDLDHGVTLGAFGAMSGAGPEVRMCSASDPTNADATSDEWTDEWCATFAYQWETGMVHGKVGSEKDHEVEVTPETGHGAIGDDDETRTGGAYSIGGLQDGVYTATATSGDAKFQLLDDAEVEGIALYHNEACWADPDPNNADCDEDTELVEGVDDDGNTTYTYANRENVSWDTGRLGLAIKGYVANDGQDGEGRDGLLRGDESMAGIEMTLYNSTNTTRVSGVDPVETDARGFYSFDDLAAGNYTIRAGSGSNYWAIHSIARYPRSTSPWRYINFKSATAQDYPTFPDEADLPKPFWDREKTRGGTMGQPTTMYTVGTGTAANSATLYNFALVYTDGELSGRVNNLSGSNASIDIIISTPNPLDDDEKVETVGSRGNFELGDLIEAMGYTAVIEDAGFTAPCMGADGMPDDDLEADDGTCGPGNSRFDTELTADIEGESDHESLGTLTVYNTRLSDADAMTAIKVMGQTAVGGDDVDLADGVTIGGAQATDATVVSVSTGPITFASESVTVDATVSGDAGVDVMMGEKVCAAGVCELDFNATGSDETSNASTEITVMVTAENGYDDHAYTFSVSRTNPVDNVLERGEILTQDGQQAGGSGGDGETAGTPWQVTTASEDDAAITLTFNLQEVGTGDDAICGQSISVKINGGATQDAINDTDNDACDDEQYRLSAGASGTVYEITITSQDDVAKKYYINLSKANGSVNDDPEVATPIPDQSLSVNATREVDVSSHFSDADGDDLTFTAVSDATATATVTVSSAVLTITGAAVGSAEITVTANDGNGGTVDDAFSVTVQPASANDDPEVATPIPDQSFSVNATREVDVSSHFSDADGDDLTFTAVSDATATATVTVSSAVLTITGAAVGSAEITVTANDGNGGTVDDAFSVTVQPASANDDPEVATPIPDQSLSVNATREVDVSSHFSDADGDDLTFTAVSDATATATVTVSSAVLTITGAAVGSAEITVTANDGNGGTVDDAFDVTVTPTSPAIILSVTEARVRENSEATYTVRLATQPANDVTVSIAKEAANGTDDLDHVTTTLDNNPLVFTNSNWGTARTVLLQVANDANEDTEIAELTHTASGPTNYTDVTAVLTVTAADDDVVPGAGIDAAISIDVAEGGAGAELMVKLSAQPNGDVVVAATLDPDPADVATITTGESLTFTMSDWQTEQPITITATEDADPVDAMTTLTLAASGGGYGSADEVEVEVNVEDDEDATISIADGVSGAEVVEGGMMTYDVTLSAPPPAGQTVRVNLSRTGPASVTPAQAEFTSTTVDNSVTIRVIPFSDSDDEDESVTISHIVDADDGSGYKSATPPPDVSVAIKDDEAAGVVVSRTSLSVEEGLTATYTVRLTSAPAAGEIVTINLAGTGVNLNQTSLSFDENNFAEEQTVTVTGHVDTNEQDDDATVVHTVTSDGTTYASAMASPVSITVKEPSDE